MNKRPGDRERRLATIMAADIVGYSRLMDTDEEGTYAALRSVRTEVLEPGIEKVGGRIAKHLGDGFLAEFSTVMSAVQFAMTLQEEMVRRGKGVPRDRRIRFRIGINLGDIIVDDDGDIFGDGVNVAARLEHMAIPGGICVSGPVYTSVRKKLDVRFDDLGDQSVKKIPTPVRAYDLRWPGEGGTPDERAVKPTTRPKMVGLIAGGVIAAIVAILLVLWQTSPFEPRDEAATNNSIAVLPFVDMSPEKTEEYFSDGLAEDLLNHLARIPGIRVVAKSSSFQFKGKYEDLRTVGRILNVSAILDGSVRRVGNRIRITARLNNTSDGFTLWSEVYDREIEDIFTVQEEIARSVAMSLKATLVGAPPSQTRNIEAYSAYLQGRYLVGRRRKVDVEKAVGYYEHAISLDSTYAPVWVSLAQVRCYQGNFGYAPLEESFRVAREELKHALELDPDLAQAHMALGWLRMSYDWDWAGADESFQRALALNPGSASIIGNASMLSATFGRLEEAIELDRRALELDPLSGWNYHIMGLHAYMAGRLDEAVSALKKALELAPEQPGTHMMLGKVYLAQMMLTVALSEMDQERNPSFRLYGLALVYHAMGRNRDADEALAELVNQFQTDLAYQIAEVYAYRGEADEAFEWLERAYEQHDGGLAEIKGSPIMKNLESDPRYTAFLKKMRLPT